VDRVDAYIMVLPCVISGCARRGSFVLSQRTMTALRAASRRCTRVVPAQRFLPPSTPPIAPRLDATYRLTAMSVLRPRRSRVLRSASGRSGSLAVLMGRAYHDKPPL